MHDRDAARRIPKSIGTGTRLFGSYTLTDLAVGLFPGVCVILLGQLVLPSAATVAGYQLQPFTLPIAGVGIVGGMLFVYLTPEYTSSLEWASTYVRYLGTDRRLDHEQAKEYTHIERVYPERGAIERTDGALIGMVQVEPPTMALATDEEWATKADAFQEFLNTTVEFPIQLYSTTQPFPAREYLDRYEQRRDDPDVEANPRLEALIDHYVDWYATDLEERRMTIRDHYVVVPVTPADVQFDHSSLVGQLATIPLVGSLIRTWYAPPRAVQLAAMLDALDDRLQRVSAGLRDIEGCTPHRVAVKDATQLIAEYWAGEPIEHGPPTATLRTRPLVDGERE